MPERDTPTISAALDAGIEALSRRSEDASRDGDSLKFGSDLQHEAYLRAREISDHARALRRLRSQIEKERPFLEAAMAYVTCDDRYARPFYERMEAAYRALSEKPPEEGARPLKPLPEYDGSPGSRCNEGCGWCGRCT